MCHDWILHLREKHRFIETVIEVVITSFMRSEINKKATDILGYKAFSPERWLLTREAHPSHLGRSTGGGGKSVSSWHVRFETSDAVTVVAPESPRYLKGTELNTRRL